MNIGRRALIATAVAGSMLVGGAIGAAAFGAGSGGAQTTTTTTPSASNGSSSSGSSGGSNASAPAPGGTFKPNEDPTHEKGESAQREAQEDAGQRPTVP